MKSKNYVHYSIELRVMPIEEMTITDYDGQLINIPCNKHFMPFKEAHKEAQINGIEIEFMPEFVHMGIGNFQDRKLTKEQRKQIEHDYRISYREMAKDIYVGDEFGNYR